MTPDLTTYTRGGSGSHWDTCHESHWDCEIRRLRAALEKAERERDDLALIWCMSIAPMLIVECINEEGRVVRLVVRTLARHDYSRGFGNWAEIEPSREVAVIPIVNGLPVLTAKHRAALGKET